VNIWSRFFFYNIYPLKYFLNFSCVIAVYSLYLYEKFLKFSKWDIYNFHSHEIFVNFSIRNNYIYNLYAHGFFLMGYIYIYIYIYIYNVY